MTRHANGRRARLLGKYDSEACGAGAARPAELLAKNLNTPGSLALDAAHVYFADERAIHVAPKDCCVQ